jgi:Holliday junction resolvase RusA-like endonuclease
MTSCRSDLKQIVFIVKGEPKGKGRPRLNRYSGSVYTPADTVQYERLVAWSYANAAHGYKFTSPVKVTVKAYHKPPKGKSKKVVGDMLNGHILPTKKPDADNVAKIILDGLNHVAWDDDTQVVEMMVTKRYCEESMVAVIIEEIDAQRC